MREFDVELTRNFNFKEFIEAQLPAKAVQLNYNYLQLANDEKFFKVYTRCRDLAGILQGLRNEVNKNFQESNNGIEISIILLSAGRTREWEKLRNRSGKSQHVNWHAVDFRVGNIECNNLYNEVMEFCYNYFAKVNWMGGLAKRVITNNEVQSLIDKGEVDIAEIYLKRPMRFVHVDLREPEKIHEQRGYGARWNY